MGIENREPRPHCFFNCSPNCSPHCSFNCFFNVSSYPLK